MNYKNFFNSRLFFYFQKVFKFALFTFAILGGLFIFSFSASAATYVSGTISTNTTWTLANSPYVVLGVTINSGATLTIDPGVIVKFQSVSSSLQVSGALKVNGTSADKVYFTSIKDDTVGGDTNGDGNTTAPAARDWVYFYFSPSSTGNISNAVIRYGGNDGNCFGAICTNTSALNISNSQITNSSYGIFQQSGSLTLISSELSNQYYGLWLAGGTTNISQSSIHDNSQYGVYVANSSVTLTLTNNTFTNNTAGPAYIDGADFTHSGNTATGTGIKGFIINGSIAANRVWNSDLPYIVQNLTVNSGATLTIDPGVIVKFPVSQYYLVISGALQVNGTSTDKVYFTSYKDDTIGGDTNGDGNTTAPAAGNWGYIQFVSGSTGNISNAVLRYGGSSSWDNNCSSRGVICNTGGSITITSSELSNQYYGLWLAGGTTNISQSSIHDNSQYGIYNSTANIINAKNNWWGNASGPYHATLNPTGTGNKVSNNVDFIPWLTYDPTKNQPPTLFGLAQYKSDGSTVINEGGITTESSLNNPNNSTVIFKATVSSPSGGNIKLQVEIKESNQPFDGTTGIIDSELVSSGNIAAATRYGLVQGQYHWQARAVDDKGNVSNWQEFGTAGNVDFEVKLVPLYTQVESDYPSRPDTERWAILDYANGNSNCGRSIAQCGCALTSSVMVLRYYGVANVNNQDVNPKTLNDWLNTQPKGYLPGGILNWLEVARYSGYQVKYNIAKSGDYANDFSRLDESLNKNQPAIAKEKSGRGGINREHFIVIDNKFASTYGIKDPAWYNTQKLNETTNITNKIRGYENGFDGLRLFYPGNGIADAAISLNLASPAEFLVTDPQGRRLGKDPITNIEYSEIPEASYFSDGIDDATEILPSSNHENKVIYINNPIDGQYDVKVIGTGSGSYTVDSVVYDNQGQIHSQTLSGNTDSNISAVYDLNYNTQQPEDIAITPSDTEAPIISHTSINSEYILNSSPIIFNFSAQDAGTGVFKLFATLDGQSISDGAVINFNQLGEHTIIIEAEDFVGNKRTETITYKVIYDFSGFLSPIKADGSGLYKLGRTLPVKFQLKDANGVFVSNAVVQLFAAKIQDGIVGTDEITLSTSSADTGNLFRYDDVNQQYIYNLATNSLSVGSWQLKVVLDDEKYYTVMISLK